MPPRQSRSERRAQRRSSPRSQHSSQTSRPARPRATPSQSGRVTDRTPPVIDYSQDYAFVRRDLKRIAIWSFLLFVGMFALYAVL